ncbi:MAG: hypothetical protein HYY40_03480 [Bacteroidetes bacterium]|nr:hypothetical protein [Bacteroidota bacterium]
MKKTFISAIAYFFALTSFGQITITETDMLDTGVTVQTILDTLYNGTQGSSGANQTWDFSALLSHKPDSHYVVLPAGQPGSSNFPGATHASFLGNFTIYFLGSSSSAEIMGAYGDVGTGSPVAVKYNPYRTYITLPSTYNTSFSGTSRATVKDDYSGYPGVDSVKITVRIQYSSNFDAWGQVTTPSGTFDVIRQRDLSYEWDSVFPHYTFPFPNWSSSAILIQRDTSDIYRWWGNGYHFPLLEINIDAGTVVEKTEYLKSIPVSGDALTPDSGNTYVLVYRDIYSAEIHFEVKGTALHSIAITDILGKAINTYSLGTAEFNLATSNFLPGIYCYRLIDNSGKVVGSGKFPVTGY